MAGFLEVDSSSSTSSLSSPTVFSEPSPAINSSVTLTEDLVSDNETATLDKNAMKANKMIKPLPSKETISGTKGRIVVYGDSACFEIQPKSRAGCEKLLSLFLDFVDSGSLIPKLIQHEKDVLNKKTSELMKYSQFELLKGREYLEKNLMSGWKILTKSETDKLENERSGRAWELSR